MLLSLVLSKEYITEFTNRSDELGQGGNREEKMTQQRKLLIKGEWVESREKAGIRGPYNGRLVGNVCRAAEKEMEAAIAAAATLHWWLTCRMRNWHARHRGTASKAQGDALASKRPCQALMLRL